MMDGIVFSSKQETSAETLLIVGYMPDQCAASGEKSPPWHDESLLCNNLGTAYKVSFLGHREDVEDEQCVDKPMTHCRTLFQVKDETISEHGSCSVQWR